MSVNQKIVSDLPATPRGQGLPAIGGDGAEATPSTAAAPPAGDLIYELQLGFFYRRHRAESLVADFEQRGYRPYVVEVKSSKAETRYTVRIGPYAAMAAAEAKAAELLREEGLAPVIRYRSRAR